MYDNNHELAEIKEKYVEGVLRRKYKYVEFFVVTDKSGKTKAQTIHQGRYNGRGPDIRIFQDVEHKNLVMRVEVKSFAQFRHNLPKELDPSISYLIVEKKAFDQYLELQGCEEVECRIVFVIGSDESNYEFFWLPIQTMYETRHYVYKYSEYRNKPSYFWDCRNFWYGLYGL